MDFERLSEYGYRIPQTAKMRSEAVFYASQEILADLRAEDYASLKQLTAVATLPGISSPALAMPDIHWGYGFPIGGVAAFDPAEGGVISPGGVGFDINCGVRLLASDLSRQDVDPQEVRLAKEPRKNGLADALFSGIPSGVGKGRKGFRLSRGSTSDCPAGTLTEAHPTAPRSTSASKTIKNRRRHPLFRTKVTASPRMAVLPKAANPAAQPRTGRSSRSL